MVVLCHVNVRSLMAPGRLAELKTLVCFNNIDILCVTETWLKFKHLDSAILLPGFQPPLRQDQTHSCGGGVAVYSCNGMSAERLPLSSPHFECVALHVNLPNCKKLVVF